VQRANAIDQLERAGEAWRDTSVALGQHIRGLTKAPRLYADAIRYVQAAQADEGVQRAVLASLPRLGREAGLTTTRLARSGCLTIATKEVGRFQESWRLLAPEESEVLAARFTRSSQASQKANLAVTAADRVADQPSLSPGLTARSRLERTQSLGGGSR
jgi:hypothetical protein